jgi:RNA polymerase sigma-70 factor (ECF subfamily)
MSDESDDSAETIVSRATELAGKTRPEMADAETLAAIADGTFAFADVDETTLERCLRAFGINSVLEAFKAGSQQVSLSEPEPIAQVGNKVDMTYQETVEPAAVKPVVRSGSSAWRRWRSIGVFRGKYAMRPEPIRYSALSLKDLVCLCAGSRDDDVWKEFVSRVGKPIGLTIMRTASRGHKPSPSLVEDLVQTTYLKLWEGRCRHLRDFAIQHPEAILGYIKKTAANVTLDYFRHIDGLTSGGGQPHVSTIDIDPEAGQQVHGSQQRIAFEVLLNEIDEHLKHCLREPDQERDRMIFWLYFRQGMSCKEIASLPTIGLGGKGVGSVIERLKHCLREQILRLPADS